MEFKIGDKVICERYWFRDINDPKRFVKGEVVRIDEKEILILSNKRKLKFKKEYVKAVVPLQGNLRDW